jgi:predicted PurR-regulated permease PerM
MTSARRQAVFFWCAGIALLAVLLFVFREILLPFVVGAAFAYAFQPLVDRLERVIGSRAVAAGGVVLLSILFLVAILLVVAPLLANQLVALLVGLPDYFSRLMEMAAPALTQPWAKYLGIDAASIRASLSSVAGQGVGLATTLIGSLWTGGWVVVNIVSLLVVTPFISFYMLRDWHVMTARLDQLIPRPNADEIRSIAHEIDHNISAFVRGQLLVALLLGIYYALALGLLGLNYGLLIGLTAGFLSFVPFLGMTTGFVVSLGMALAQFWPSWPLIIAVVIIFIIGEALESYVLQPRLIGRRVGLHPVWVIFALFAFGLLFGFVGLFVAIPVAAAIGVLVRFGLEKYEHSFLYTGARRRERP